MQLNKLSTGRDAPELVIIINPQWETRGNLMSDFGFGQRKADAEKFIASFQPTYCLKQLRVYGDSVRWAWVRVRGIQGGRRHLRADGENAYVHTLRTRKTLHCLPAFFSTPTSTPTKFYGFTH